MRSYSGQLIARLPSSLNSERGQAMVEYSLLLAFIALAVVVAATSVGLAVAGKFPELSDALGG